MIKWLLVFGFAYTLGGTDAEMLADKGARVNQQQTRLQTLSVQLFACLGRLILSMRCPPTALAPAAGASPLSPPPPCRRTPWA